MDNKTKFLQEQISKLEGKINRSIEEDNFGTYKNALSSWGTANELLEKREDKNIFRPMYSYYSTDEGIFVATWEQNSLGEIKRHRTHCIEKCNTDKDDIKYYGGIFINRFNTEYTVFLLMLKNNKKATLIDMLDVPHKDIKLTIDGFIDKYKVIEFVTDTSVIIDTLGFSSKTNKIKYRESSVYKLEWSKEFRFNPSMMKNFENIDIILGTILSSEDTRLQTKRSLLKSFRDIQNLKLIADKDGNAQRIEKVNLAKEDNGFLDLITFLNCFGLFDYIYDSNILK